MYIKIISLFFMIGLFSACSYHSNIYPDELRNPRILTDDFVEASDSISIRNDTIEFPNWSFRIFGKRILPILTKNQKLYVRELERLRKIQKEQLKIEKLEAKDQVKRMKYERSIEKINNFPKEVKSGKSNFFLWLYTHDYKKVGYEYVYSEKALFWGLVKWGKKK